MPQAIKLINFNQVMKRVRSADPAIVSYITDALYQEGLDIIRASIEQVPVDESILRNSHYVRQPKQGGDPKVDLGYGTDYALYVHERTGLRHDKGNDHYLSAPFEKASTGFLKRIVLRVAGELQADMQPKALGSNGGVPNKPKGGAGRSK